MKQEDHFACPKHNMRKVILIAGGGELPNQVVRNFKANKILFHCISFKNNPLPKFNNLENYKIINYGKIITELNRLKNMGFKDIIMIGNLYRPKISEIKPDINALKLIPKFTRTLLKGGDNNLLTLIIESLEKLGFKIIDIRNILPENFLGKGNQTIIKLADINKQDIKKGQLILNTISKFDIGQSIIIHQGNVLGIETLQGTDNLIKNSSIFSNDSIKPTLIKLVKKRQQLKVDLPTIGIKTLKNCRKFSIGGIAYSAEKTLFVDKEKIVNFCNLNKIFLYGI